MRSLVLIPAALLAVACNTEQRSPVVLDPECFGTRVLSFRDLTAEVLIPTDESCERGTFRVVFTRGADTLQTLEEERVGTVGFIGTADVDADGLGEFFVATQALDEEARGVLYAYTERSNGIQRFELAELTAEQLEGYAGRDRFGFGGADRLVRGFPVGTGADTAWFAYNNGTQTWNRVERPDWLR